MTSTELQLALLGGLSVSRAGQPLDELSSQKARALLGYLALTDRPQPRPLLAGLLWGRLPEDRALMNLRKALAQLRPQVGEWLDITRQQVAFNHDRPHRIDAVDLTSAGEGLSSDEHLTGTQLAHLEQAIDLYQGDFLEGFYVRDAPEFEQWVLGKRAYFRELAMQMLHHVASAYRKKRENKSAIKFTRRLLRLEPWRESAHRDLMRLLAEDGQRGAALAQYEQSRRILQEELGVDPSDETERLFRAIQSGISRSQPVPDIPDLKIEPKRPSFLNGKKPDGETAGTAFVCRENHLARLSEHLRAALALNGRVVFVSAEAGMGKTSLLARFSSQAQQTYPDLIVASGVCTTYTGKGDPYLPFREILRMLSCDLEGKWSAGEISRGHALRLWRQLPTTIEALATRGRNLVDTFVPCEALLGRAVAHEEIAPELTQQLQGLLDLSQDAGLNQERIFEAYTDVLRIISEKAPLLLILDDLHWADPSSISLLFHLGRRLINAPILIVGAYRPEDVYLGREGNPHPLDSVLDEFKRLFGNTEIILGHGKWELDRRFVDALLDTEPNLLADDFRAQLTYSTRGHPLFTIEMLREMQERSDITQDQAGRWIASSTITWDALPGRVEGVIEKRINRLDPVLQEVLLTASVEGEEFTAEVIAQIRGIDRIKLIRMLSQDLAKGHRLIRARGVSQPDGPGVSHYQFTHNLFQKYLYSTLDPVERVHLHRAIGEALEDLHRERINEIAVHLARHFQEARLSLKASQYLLLAGQRAARLLAHEEAAMHLERGLSELATLTCTPEISHLEYELQLALAQALWHAGRVSDAVAAFQEAIENARALNDPQALARAVLAHEEPRWRLNLGSELSHQYIREALSDLGEAHSGLQVRLLVSLSRSLLASGEQDELMTTVEQALRIARQINDPLALCDALRIKAHIDRRPESITARLAAIREMIATAESIGDQERLADGLDLYVYDLLEMGRIDLADQMIAAQRRAAGEIKQPFQIHIATVFRTTRAIMRGEFSEAERLANEAADLSRQIGLAEMDGIFGIQMFTIRREQGRIYEIAPLIKLVVANSPETSAWRPGLALMYAILGLKQECRTIFEALASDGFAIVPQDSLWVATLAYLSEVCAYLGDRDRAATLYEFLLPYSDRTVVVGGATACLGAVARYLGILAAAMSDWAAAEQHFQEAIELDTRIGAWPWLGHSQYEYAAMMLNREQDNDRERANALLVEAQSAAHRMGMAYLAQKVSNLLAQA
ncbi:MAG: BTAD domain-containing putative transcriptional regulator [Anaerolineales bacterium]